MLRSAPATPYPFPLTPYPFPVVVFHNIFKKDIL
jgi:hypothetical protein